MTLWKFKSCPRCNGDVFVDKDTYGWCEQCIQCGYVRDLTGSAEPGLVPKDEKNKKNWKSRNKKVVVLSR